MKQIPAMYENGQDDFKTCPRCDADMEWEDCWKCGGEGGRDLYEEDSLAYEPGDWATCEECGGTGSIDFCPEARRHTA